MKKVENGCGTWQLKDCYQTYFSLLLGLIGVWGFNSGGTLASAQSIYISPNGNDTNAGTSAAAPVNGG